MKRNTIFAAVLVTGLLGAGQAFAHGRGGEPCDVQAETFRENVTVSVENLADGAVVTFETVDPDLVERIQQRTEAIASGEPHHERRQMRMHMRQQRRAHASDNAGPQDGQDGQGAEQSQRAERGQHGPHRQGQRGHGPRRRGGHGQEAPAWRQSAERSVEPPSGLRVVVRGR